MTECNDLSAMPFHDISTYELTSDLFFRNESVRNDIYQNTTFYNSIVSSSNNDILRQLKKSFKPGVDDESGRSMELMEGVPLKELGDAELERLVRG